MKTISNEKGEERAASEDCKLGGFKHKIFKWKHRIVKKQPIFYYFQDKHKLLEGKLEFKEHNCKFNSYEMEILISAARHKFDMVWLSRWPIPVLKSRDNISIIAGR